LLTGAAASDLASATGLSRSYCRLVMKGERIPHPRHWDALKRMNADD